MITLVSEKEQLRKYEKEGKKVMQDNLDDEKKEHFKKEDNKRKIKKRDNLGRNEKEQLRKHKKEGKKVMHDNLDEKKSILKIRTTKEKKKSVITSVIMKKNS